MVSQFLKWFVILLFISVGISVLTMGIRLLFFPIRTVDKLLDTAEGIQDKTLDADNAIYNYEWFKQQYEDIQRLVKQTDNATIAVDNFEASIGERSTWTFEDKNEHARLTSIELGLKNEYEAATADYNARAKMANRNIFKDTLLPGYIDALTFIKQQ